MPEHLFMVKQRKSKAFQYHVYGRSNTERIKLLTGDLNQLVKYNILTLFTADFQIS
jgi:hypothetical protein